MSCGRVYCSKCGRELFQSIVNFARKWLHEIDKSDICDNAQAIYKTEDI